MSTSRLESPSSVLHPVVRRIVTTLLVLSVVLPLLYMVVLSVSPDVEIADGVVVPKYLQLDNYVKMWQSTGLAKGLLNSTIICGSAALGAVLVGSLAGYVTARIRFRGRGVFTSMLLAFQSVPTVMTLLPLFIVMSGLQQLLHLTVIGTYWSVALTYLTFALPLVTWFIASYVQSVPRDLDDAARIEGAGALRIFWKIILPLIMPAAAVAGVLSFLVGWGDLLIATVLSGPSTHTVAVVLDSFLANESLQGSVPMYGELMGASIVSALPVVILYLGLQRFIVAGLTGGSLKG